MPARHVIGMDCSTTATKAVVWTGRATPSAGLHPGRAARGSDGNKDVNKPGPVTAGPFPLDAEEEGHG
jgi:hypothetical protein